MCTNGMFVVPRETPGVEIMPEPRNHNHIIYRDVRVPADHLLGPEDGAKVLAQRRLGGGRIHHAMRTIAQCQLAFDMMCERALSRTTKGSLLAEKQMVQEQVADAWIDIEQFRLLVLYTAWLIDQSSTRQVRQYIAACKTRAAEVLTDVTMKAQHIHGALGASNLMAFANATTMGLTDGPTEVHKVTVARAALKQHRASPDLWPTEFRPRKLVEHRRRFDQMVDERISDAADREQLGRLLQDGPASDEAVKRFEEYLELTANY
jgi:alkylation response protein AidB-like acyl-CoA dehydrogenase